jgi:TRAP-type C4-dicarboxylate transport system permease small subunit
VRTATPGGRPETSTFRDAFYTAFGVVKKINLSLLAVAAVAIFAINAFTIWEVFTRYALKDPATWTYPVTSYLLLYTIYLASAYALQQGDHVSVDIVVEHLPGPLRRFTQRLAHLLGLAFILVFLWQAWRFEERAIRDGERDLSMLAVPLSMAIIAIPIGLAVMAVTYVFIIVDSFLAQAPAGSSQEQREITEV